jgi:phosphatidate cytidylyltransferase
MASTLPRRVTVAAVAIPAALGLVYLGGWPLVVALVVLGVLGVHEIFRLAEVRGHRPLRVLGLLGALVAPPAAFGVVGPHPLPAVWLVYGGVAWLIAVMWATLALRTPTEGPLAAVAVTVFAPLYAAVLPSFLLVLRHGNPSWGRWSATWIVFLPLVVTWVCDSMAMAGGAVMGGPKLAPVVSPKKTWSGTITGSLSAAIVAPLYGWLVLRPSGIEIGVWRLVALGLVLSVVGQVGDLAESLLKREAGVKDSGGFFPGHGGVLDRLDSLYWVLPTAALLLSVYGVV